MHGLYKPTCNFCFIYFFVMDSIHKRIQETNAAYRQSSSLRHYLLLDSISAVSGSSPNTKQLSCEFL